MKERHQLSPYQQRISRAYYSLLQHLDQPLDMDRLANEAAFSLYHFHRLYRIMIGETVAETHRRLRLERAAGQMIRSPLSITRLALEAGYENPPAFTRAFKQHFGCSPAEYRKRGKTAATFVDPLTTQCFYPPVTKESIMQDIVIENHPARVLYGIHHQGSYFEVGPIFTELYGWVYQSGLGDQLRGMVGIYFDDPATTPEEQCRSMVCVEIASPYPAETERVKRFDIPAGRFLRYRHTGSYRTLSQAYSTLYGQWLPASGHEPADFPAFEVYLNDNSVTPEEELLTDIYVKIN